MICRQLAISRLQPPNWTVTEPSTFGAPNRPGEQAEQHRQPATELNDDRQDPSRLHHWQALLDEHRLRGRRPEQLSRTADEEQKAQQYAPEEHRRIVGSLHFRPVLSVFWRDKPGHDTGNPISFSSYHQHPNSHIVGCRAFGAVLGRL